MIRQALSILVPLLAPTLIYLYLKNRTGTPVAIAAKDAPWVWLSAAGVALAAVILGAWALTSGGSTESVYEPAHIEDGRVVPGRVVPIPRNDEAK